MAKVMPFPNWLDRAARRAEDYLRSLPPAHIGPAARLLLGYPQGQ